MSLSSDWSGMPTSLPPPSSLQSVPLVCLSRATFACRCPRPCLEKWKSLNAAVLTHAAAALSRREEYRQSLMVFLHGRLGEIWATRNATSPLSDKQNSELASWPCLWVDTEWRWWAVRLEENTALSDTRKIQQLLGVPGLSLLGWDRFSHRRSVSTGECVRAYGDLQIEL